MDIYDYMTCDTCKKTYFGHFKANFNGDTRCIDCKNPEKLSERIILDDVATEDYERLLVFYMLEKDLNELYPLFTTTNTLPLMDFMDDNGDLLLEKVYFQGNDLGICWEYQQVAYHCLKYLDTNQQEYIKEANEHIKKYLSMREKNLPEKDMKKIKAYLTSDYYKQLLEVVGEHV